MPTSKEGIEILNNQVCGSCLKRRGEHFFVSNMTLSCQQEKILSPDIRIFSWNGEYKAKNQSIIHINPNSEFKRKNT